MKIKKVELYGNSGYIVFDDATDKGIFGFVEKWEDKDKVSHDQIKLQECFNHELGMRLQWNRLGKKSIEWHKYVPSVCFNSPVLARGAVAIIEQLLKDMVSGEELLKEDSQIETESGDIDKMLWKIGRI